MAAARWTVEQVPVLVGRTMVVTGGNSGIGFEAARVLAQRGARVVLGCRDPAKAEGAVRAIRQESRGAAVESIPLDLASLESIRAFVDTFSARHTTLDVLCNNAGVMALPYMRTADGFEMQLGTNHLGHFALTGLLLDRLLATPDARVVTVSSTAHRIGRIRLDDLNGEAGYGRWTAYGQSKLANLLFTFELQRRLAAAGTSAISVACHPGYAATNLQLVAPRLEGSRWMESLSRLGNRLLAQDAAAGALPTLYAATATDVRGGDYFGPGGLGEIRGHPTRVASSARSRDVAVAARLWEVSERLTGVRFGRLDH
jgi:NAD(P)-dependent dehydrogenase (short-subunit alcohol dehydrogenase family)